MPQSDSKLGELSRVRNKLIELDGLLKEERKITARLRDQSEKKSEQIAIVDAEITAEMERFRWKKEELVFSMRSLERDAKGKIALMKYDEKKLLQELAEGDIVQHDNERLSAQLKEITNEKSTLNQTYIAEREARNQKDFDTRMAMEETLRKMIKSVDHSYQTEAIAKMQLEALNANTENERIHIEFSLREAKTESLIRQQQRSYEQLMRIKIERDVMAVSVDVQERNIVKMRRQNEINEIKLRILQKQVQSVQDEVKSLTTALDSKQSLEEQGKELHIKIETQTNVLEQWRKVALRVAKKIIKECQEIGDKNRVRDNAKLTQQLDDLISQQNADDEASLGSRSRHSSHYSDDDEKSLNSFHDNLDYEAVWRCPTKKTLQHYYSTGKLMTPNDWRRARSKEGEGMNKNKSAPLLMTSQGYKSFSM